MVKCQNRAFTATVASPQCHPTQVSDIPVMLRQFSLQCMQIAACQNTCSFDFLFQLHKITHAAATAENFFVLCLNRTCFLVNAVNHPLPVKSNMFLRKISLTASPNLQSGAPALASERRWGERLENLSGHLEMTKRGSQDPTFLMWLDFIAANALQMPSTLNNSPAVLGTVFVPLWGLFGVPAVILKACQQWARRIISIVPWASSHTTEVHVTPQEASNRLPLKPAKAEV